jgi:hypothetical protein
VELATEKQLAYIADIEEVVDEKFTGRTKKEASDYIDRNALIYNLYFNDSYELNS